MRVKKYENKIDAKKFDDSTVTSKIIKKLRQKNEKEKNKLKKEIYIQMYLSKTN